MILTWLWIKSDQNRKKICLGFSFRFLEGPFRWPVKSDPKPEISSFRFLEEEQLLSRVFTQNIDGLDYQTGISREKVTNVHGSLARVSCEGCKREMPFETFCQEA